MGWKQGAPQDHGDQAWQGVGGGTVTWYTQSQCREGKGHSGPNAADVELEMPDFHLGWGHGARILGPPPSPPSSVTSLMRLLTPFTVPRPHPWTLQPLALALHCPLGPPHLEHTILSVQTVSDLSPAAL